MKPKVSVIMPVLNGQRFIDEAIQSIVDQGYENLEFVVVDDGSTDRTVDRIDAFRDRLDIRYVRHETPKGISVSVNDGLRHATGDLIAFLDHDDAWFPHFLRTQTTYLEQHPDVGMVHSDFQTVDVEGNVIEASVAAARGRTRPSGHVFRQLFQDSFIVGNSVLIRRECFTRLGTFDEGVPWGDYQMWLRIARHYKIDYVDEVLTKYRMHPTQTTRSRADERPDDPPPALRAIERLVERHPEIREELGDRVVRQRMASFYFDRAWSWFSSGEPVSARLCVKRALRLWPTNPRYLVLYLASFLGASQGRAARQAWRRLRGERVQLAPGMRGLTK